MLHRLIAGCLLCVGFVTLAAGQEVRREIAFPDLPDYQTLVCDLHMHTMFSDGDVWPTVRVNEAWRMGLDAIAISDHIEYQPHKADVPTNHNRPYELMVGRAREKNILLIRGAEITRDTPPGHFNAIFLEDAAGVDTPEFVDAIRLANEQGAFVFWNHQAWQGEERGRWMDVHTTLYDNKWFQGMEVANGDSYYPTAHQWCLDKNLTMLGNSDIHAPDLRLASTSADHRTMTLVFAKERSVASVEEALRQGRTAVWYQNQVIGRPEWLEPLLEAGVTVSPPYLRTGNAIWIEIHNGLEVDLEFERNGSVGPAKASLPAGATQVFKISTPQPKQAIELAYRVTNFLVAPGAGLDVTWTVPAAE